MDRRKNGRKNRSNIPLPCDNHRDVGKRTVSPGHDYYGRSFLSRQEDLFLSWRRRFFSRGFPVICRDRKRGGANDPSNERKGG